MRLSGRGKEGQDLVVRRAGGHLVADGGVQGEQRALERVHHDRLSDQSVRWRGVADAVDRDVVNAHGEAEDGEHLLRHRRREAQRLARGRERRHDRLDVLLKATVEELVALV